MAPTRFQYPLLVILVLVLFLQCQLMHAQGLSLKISDATFSLEDNNYKGYTSKLSQPYSLVKKEWWRYIKKISSIENHKSHYIITFPSDENSENSGLSFISVLEDDSCFVTLKTALAKQENNKEHKKIAYNLLLAFKVKFYSEIVQKQISASEKKAGKISQEINKYKKREIAIEKKKSKGKGNRISLSNQLQYCQSIQDSLNIELQKNQFRIENSKLELKNIK